SSECSSKYAPASQDRQLLGFSALCLRTCAPMSACYVNEYEQAITLIALGYCPSGAGTARVSLGHGFSPIGPWRPFFGPSWGQGGVLPRVTGRFTGTGRLAGPSGYSSGQGSDRFKKRF